jgi:hypothetical protein
MSIFLSAPSMARQFFYWMNILPTVHINPTIRESTIAVLNNVPHCCQKNFKIKSRDKFTATDA